ncbi:uncharacterized protein LOC129574869 [Sitodiplosis mosellana]|uniref:uncharacterized protein LOC129574869 n=1 Tax=Sitodiplosis mosellana TaxID=263140 RepID=UPI0024447578|nr:uncharacterized protein LOC129574869 [Sitodiplosis mosellana]XP_055313380.1 uncharacterized protein LOC129574869 [Sitodiplosis mosellana]
MESNNEKKSSKKSSMSDSSSKNRFYTDGLPLIIHNFEHFPTEILLAIFAQINDNDLLNLGSISARFEPMVREVFAERYADQYFQIEAETERHRNLYSELFNLFGNSMRAIQAIGIRNIDDNHWLVQILDKHTPNLEKLYFKKCSFKNVDHFLSRHIKITHLAFCGGSCEKEYHIQLPEYRNLKSLELFEFSYISKPSLEQIFLNNPQMERLILSFCDHYFTLPNIMELVYTHLKNLKVLNILDSYEKYGDISLPISLMNRFVSALTSLQSFGMTIFNESSRDLLRRMGSNCKSIKCLELYNFQCGYFSRELINREAVCLFDKVETLSLLKYSNQEKIEQIIENLPFLRCLSISKISYCSNDEILTILRKCTNLEKLIIEPENTWTGRYNEDESLYRRNAHFHEEFIEAIPNSHFRLEFKEKGEVIGIVTKEEIIWRNKLLHWVGYDPILSRSKLQLLDLATIPKWSTGKHKQPLNLIFNHLDLDSLYSFCMTSKESKQLVHNYIQHRCKPSPKKCTKQRSIQRGKFFVTDEFGIDNKGLQMFGKCMKYLEVNLLNYHIGHFLNMIDKHCKILKILCFRTHQKIDPDRFILPQIRHFIFYGYDKDCTYDCDLSFLSRQCPNLEILEMKTVAKLCAFNKKVQHSFENLQMIKFKPFDHSQVKYVKDLFKNSTTEVVIDSEM